MAFLGPTYLDQIDGAIQEGRGAAASVLAQTYDVYRLSDATQDAVISGTPVITGFQARIERITKKTAIENAVFDILVYKATCDNRTLQLGDILVETGYESDGGQYCFAQARPTRETLWVRVESNSAIQRPYPYGGANAQQPSTPGFKSAPGFGGTSQFNRDKLVLVNGQYDWEPAASTIPIASIPIGIQPTARVSPKREPDLPTVVPESRFFAYIPPLPGVELTELTVIKAMHADNYEIMALHNTEATGLQGYVCICRKLAN